MRRAVLILLTFVGLVFVALLGVSYVGAPSRDFQIDDRHALGVLAFRGRLVMLRWSLTQPSNWEELSSRGGCIDRPRSDFECFRPPDEKWVAKHDAEILRRRSISPFGATSFQRWHWLYSLLPPTLPHWAVYENTGNAAWPIFSMNYVVVPLWALALFSLVCPGVAVVRWWCIARRRARGLCGTCGYDLRGSDGESCPECGSNARLSKRGYAARATAPCSRGRLARMTRWATACSAAFFGVLFGMLLLCSYISPQECDLHRTDSSAFGARTPPGKLEIGSWRVNDGLDWKTVQYDAVVSYSQLQSAPRGLLPQCKEIASATPEERARWFLLANRELTESAEGIWPRRRFTGYFERDHDCVPMHVDMLAAVLPLWLIPWPLLAWPAWYWVVGPLLMSWRARRNYVGRLPDDIAESRNGPFVPSHASNDAGASVE